MSLLGSLVNMLGSGSQGQGDNLALINAVVRMLGNDSPGGGLGADTIAQIARQLGLDNGEVAGQLSQVLPHVVDALTPDGHLPAEGLGSGDDLLDRLGPR